MPTAHEYQTLKQNLRAYEGYVEHMYLDGMGHVTIGVGHLLSTVTDAQKLSLHKDDGTSATKEEIKAEYENIEKQPPNMHANRYGKIATLRMKRSDIESLTNKHIRTFGRELRRIYSDFDKYPSEARLALFDMIFNLGMTKLRNKWPSLNKRVFAREWGEAAKHCHRQGIQASRNSYVKNLFLAAEKQKNRGPTIMTLTFLPVSTRS